MLRRRKVIDCNKKSVKEDCANLSCLILHFTMAVCVIGKLSKNVCSGIDIQVKLSEFSTEVLSALEFKVKSSFDNIESSFICNKHKHRYIDNYSAYRNQCCDPFEHHATPIRGGLRIISFAISNTYYKVSNKRLIPEDKFCKRCEQRVNEEIEKNITSQQPDRPHGINLREREEITLVSMNSELGDIPCTPSTSSQSSSGSEFISCSQGQATLQNICQQLGIRPIELSKYSIPRKENLVVDLFVDIEGRLITKIKEAFNVDINLQVTPVTNSYINDSVSLQHVLTALKARFQSSHSVSEKISILTAVPSNWTLDQCRKYFDCTSYMYNKMRKQQKQGIFYKKYLRSGIYSMSPDRL